MLPVLDQLPSVPTIIIPAIGYIDFEVNFLINYNSTAMIVTASVAARLRHFTFGIEIFIFKAARNRKKQIGGSTIE